MQRCEIVRKSPCFVGFSDETNLAYLKLLKHGFRHCFLFFGDGYQTVVIDPLSNRIDYSVLLLDVFKAKKMFEEQGITVLAVVGQYTPKFTVKLGLFTCVEVVKRFLGISNIFIITPFRLYKYLKNNIGF